MNETEVEIKEYCEEKSNFDSILGKYKAQINRLTQSNQQYKLTNKNLKDQLTLTITQNNKLLAQISSDKNEIQNLKEVNE